MDPHDKFAGRKGEYKKVVDEDALRRKREEHAVKLGRAKKEEQRNKRRQALEDEDPSAVAAAAPGFAGAAAAPAPSGRVGGRLPTAEDIPFLITQMKSGDEGAMLEAVTAFRKMLSKEDHPPIDTVIEAGLVAVFVRLLNHHNPRMQFESAWALTNIASGTSFNTQRVVDEGAIPVLVGLLASPTEDVREQAVWALGNIAGDSPQYRDLVLAAGALPPLLAQLGPGSKLSFVRNATWTISNCMRGKPTPPLAVIAPALPMLARLLYSEDVDTLVDALWALSYFTDADDVTMLQMAVQAGVADRVVALLKHESPLVQTPALRTLGNIVTGDEIQTQVMINAGALDSLQYVLQHGKRALKKEACWAVSNVMAGAKEQIQAAIDANLVHQLVQILSTGHRDVKREACWALSNATSGGSPDQVLAMVRQAVIPELVAMSEADDSKIGLVAMEGLENIMRAGETIERLGRVVPGHIIELCLSAGVPDMLNRRSLLYGDGQEEEHEADVAKKAETMLNKWFPHWEEAGGYGEDDDDDDDDEGTDDEGHHHHDGHGHLGHHHGGLAAAAPGVGADGHYMFGGGHPAGMAPAAPIAAAAPSPSVNAAGQFVFGGAGGAGGFGATPGVGVGWGGVGGGGAAPGSAFAAPAAGAAPPIAPVIDHSFRFGPA